MNSFLTSRMTMERVMNKYVNFNKHSKKGCGLARCCFKRIISKEGVANTNISVREGTLGCLIH